MLYPITTINFHLRVGVCEGQNFLCDILSQLVRGVAGPGLPGPAPPRDPLLLWAPLPCSEHISWPRRHALPVIRSDQDHIQHWDFSFRIVLDLVCITSSLLRKIVTTFCVLFHFSLFHIRESIFIKHALEFLIFWTSIQINEQLKYLSLSIKCSTLLLNYF